jgi:hypothetical protein
MAKKSNNILQGSIANVIHYEWKGKQCMRSMPRKFNRTEASVKSGLNFGKASSLSREIRQLIAYVNPCKDDNTVMFRFTGVLNQFINWKSKHAPVIDGIITELPFIRDFQFNNQCDLSNIPALKVSAKINDPGKLEVSLPSFNPYQILGVQYFANQALCKMILTVSNLDTGVTEISDTATIDIPVKDELFQPPVLSMRTSTGKNELVILVMALQYVAGLAGGSDMPTEKEMITDKKKLPCVIAWAYCS